MKRASKKPDTLRVPDRSIVTADRSALRGPSRATLRVAAANRILAAELPHVIYQGRAAVRPAPLSDPAVPDRSSVAESVKRPDRPVPQNLSLNRRDEVRCKARPDDSRKGGGGGGPKRDFVPWCRK